jgi:3-oxoacyl-[acyl-carrier-protein] synthase II
LARRVVITGVGVISSISLNTKDFWAGCLAGKTNVSEIPRNWLDYSNYNSGIWSPLPDLSTLDRCVNRIEQKQLDPATIMAIDACVQALIDAGLEYELIDKKRNTYNIKSLDKSRAGVYLGTGIGGISTVGYCMSNQILSRQHEIFKNALLKLKTDYPDNNAIKDLESFSEKMLYPKRYNPFAVSMIMPNASSANLGIKFELNGPNQTLSLACASGTIALGAGYKAILNDEVDFVLSGGTEYMYDEYGALYYAFDVIKALARSNDDISKANRPFDRDRTGFLYSQGGAAVLVLEELEHAKKRNAPIVAEIVGYAENCDGYNIMMIEENGDNIKKMIKTALDNAGIKKEEIDYINTHGTGTQLNDEIESSIIYELFGEKPLVNSTKSLIGHTLGASGAIEAVVTVLSIKNKTTHICKNLENPIRDLNFVTIAKDYDIKTALSQSFGFGGHNSVLVFKEFRA